MDTNYDVLNIILRKIVDINTLINFCNANKKIRDLCAERSFWKPIFKKYNLPLPHDFNYNNMEDWIYEFYHTYYVYKNVNNIYNNLNNFIGINTKNNPDIYVFLQLLNDIGIDVSKWRDRTSGSDIITAINNGSEIPIIGVTIARGPDNNFLLFFESNLEHYVFINGVELKHQL